MRVLYISGPAFFDLDLSFVRSLRKRVECYFLLDLYPKLHRATAVEIHEPRRERGILPIGAFEEFDVYREYLDPKRTFVLNRVSDQPLAWSNVALQVAALRFVQKLRPDVVHFNNYIYFTHFYLFLCPGKKLITIHDPFPHSGEEQQFRAATARITRFVNHKLIANHLLFNRVLSDRYREEYHLSDKNIVTSSIGVYDHLEVFADSCDCPPSDILFFGRLAEYKGVDVLLDAFRLVLAKLPGAVLTIAGAGDVGFDVDRYELPPGRLNLIHRYIPTAELASLIKHTKIVVCPYKDATQSGVIMTAFALSKPVVATRVGGLVEMVDDGETGTLVAPNDCAGLAEAIVDLLTDDRKREMMEEQIRRVYVDGEKGWDRIIDRLLTIYGDLR